MLDSLGSTLTEETLDGYFTANSLDPEKDELTIEQVVAALEKEVNKSREDKKIVGPEETFVLRDEAAGSSDIPSLDLIDKQGQPNHALSISVSGPDARPPGQEASIDPMAVARDTNGLNHHTNQVPLTDEAGIPYDEDEGDEDDTDSGPDSNLERVINIKECPLCHRRRLSKRTEVDIVTHLAVSCSAFLLISPSCIYSFFLVRFALVRIGQGSTGF